MPNPIARPSPITTAASPEPAGGPQLPRFLWGVGPDDEDEAPAYHAVPLDDVPKPPSSALHSHDTDTTPTHHASSEVDRVSSTSTAAVTHDANHENTERDSPVIGTAGNKIEDITQTPVFAQLKAAQAGLSGGNSSSVYTFGRRLATCKFFRPTKGYGFLNDIKPAELGHQDVMVHATELYGPRNARIQSLARGELVEHRGFYAVSVTGPGAVPVIGDAACNNGSIAYGRVSGISAATQRPPMTLAAAAQAPILAGDRRPPGLPLPPRYDNDNNGQVIDAPSPLSPTFGGSSFRGSPLASPSGASFTSATPPLPSPRFGHGWPSSYSSSNLSDKSTLETLMEQNQQLMRRLALLEGRANLPSSAPAVPPASAAGPPTSIWAPLNSHV